MMRPQGLRPGARAPICHLLATALLQPSYMDVELRLKFIRYAFICQGTSTRK